MKKHLGIALALLSILATLSLANTVNAANWGVSEGDTYEWDVIEATEGYEEGVGFYNATPGTGGMDGNVIYAKVVTGDVIKFSIDKLNTSDTSPEVCRGTLELGNVTINNTDQASIAGALILGSWAFFQPGLISSTDWDTVKDNADIVGWNYTESGNSITFESESILDTGISIIITTADITYDKNNGVLTEGKTNTTTDVRLRPLFSSTESEDNDEIIVTAISLELVEEDDDDWLLIGGIAVALAVIAVLVVLLKRR